MKNFVHSDLCALEIVCHCSIAGGVGESNNWMLF
jgi:hypothetical protein